MRNYYKYWVRDCYFKKYYCRFFKDFNLKYGRGMVFFREFEVYFDDSF